ncbi:DUF58 domain-containing protein [Alteromonas sp. BL110]|uniref:DUF58 domain-containing protein n=1 Tax=Alteromonas sp. BL110 TaxID=1714845 RepID=UPI000E54B57E|nr:DUF58 domain-containing protein [Alteromonas sp. BL110]AXT37506.1 DUF58 domain-containing protein [Alteromonas sp. BL110]RKM80245.1 DUF58 domain-containing protein [Alteromonas sp. BL110]
MVNVQAQLSKLQCNGVSLSSAELLRYQQLAKLFSLAPKRMPRAKLAGSYLTKHKGRGMEFDEARHYQPGDDIRAIDWRVTARTGKTHTKVYREERERPVFLFCDYLPSMAFGTQLLTKAVQAAHVSSLISWSAAARGDKVGALLFNQQQHKEIKPLTRKKAVLHVCHELMALHEQSTLFKADKAKDEQAFADACARARRLARPGSLVYLVSDFQHLSAQAIQHLSHLTRHCEVRAIVIHDPIEHALPQTSSPQTVSVSDGHNQQRWVLGDNTEQQQYLKWRNEHNSAIYDTLRKTNIARFSVSAGLPLDEQLQNMQQEQWLELD